MGGMERAAPVLTSMLNCEWFKGAVAHGNYFFPKKFEFVSLCSFICLQAVYQLSGPVCKATWNGFPSYSASYRFVIDFLSIRKVIIFSAIATDDRHPLRHVLYTKMLQIA